ncbi:hypothetical protein BR93DRAFT_927330 [Coniochaeta sp. PMI_546]|nr:hypothetical protein BR93DRAFT_927330 [Coniochaeta sp. PMI_546]
MTTTTLTILVFAIKSKLSTRRTVDLNSDFTSAYSLYKQGGDCYVSSIQLGGSYMAAYCYNAETTEEFEELKIAADGIFKYGTNPFTPSFSDDIKRLSKTTNITSRFIQRGVGFSEQALPNEDQLSDFVLKFGTLTLDGPEVMEFETQSYSTLLGCPHDFANIDVNRGVWVSDNPGRLTPTLYDDLVDLQNTLVAIEETTAIYNYYGALSLDASGSLKTASAMIRNVIRKNIGPWLDEVCSDPTQVKTRPVFEESLFNRPEAQYYLHTDEVPSQMTPWCEEYFKSVDISQVPSGIRPTGIQFFEGYDSQYQSMGHGIGQIRTTYTCNLPGHVSLERINGKMPKTALPPFSFVAGDEYVNSVRVWQNAMTPAPWIIPVMVLKVGLTTNSQAEVAQPPDVWPEVPPELVEIETYTPPEISQGEVIRTRLIGFAGYVSKNGMIQSLVPVWLVLQRPVWSDDVNGRCEKKHCKRRWRQRRL